MAGIPDNLTVADRLLGRADVRAAAEPILIGHGKSITPAAVRRALDDAGLDITEDEREVLVDLIPRVGLTPDWEHVDEPAPPLTDDAMGASTSGYQMFLER